MPAFVGLGAPYWDPDARGAIIGLTRGTRPAEIARATLDVDRLPGPRRRWRRWTPTVGRAAARSLRVDGGRPRTTCCCSSRRDLLGVPVERPVVAETTALGAAYLAGLAVGFWRDTAEVAANWALDRRFEPSMEADRRGRPRLAAGVERPRGWAGPDDLTGALGDASRRSSAIRARSAKISAVQVRRQSPRLRRGKAVIAITAIRRSSTTTRTPLTADARTREGSRGYREEFSFSCTTTRI